MSNINPQLNRSAFFSGTEPAKFRHGSSQARMPRNSTEKKKEIESNTKNDVRVDIADRVKDFARIKAAVDRAPTPDNSERIAELKNRIRRGDYRIDDNALADKILQSSF